MQKLCIEIGLMKTQDLSMTYLGQTKMTRETRIKAEEKFPNYQTRFYFRKTVRWY